MSYASLNDSKDWTANVEVVPSLRKITLKSNTETAKPAPSPARQRRTRTSSVTRRRNNRLARSASSKSSAETSKSTKELNVQNKREEASSISSGSKSSAPSRSPRQRPRTRAKKNEIESHHDRTSQELQKLPSVNKPTRSSTRKIALMEDSFGNLSTSTPTTLACSFSSLSPSPYNTTNRAKVSTIMSSPTKQMSTTSSKKISPRRLPQPPLSTRSKTRALAKAVGTGIAPTTPVKAPTTNVSFNACFPNPIDFPMTSPVKEERPAVNLTFRDEPPFSAPGFPATPDLWEPECQPESVELSETESSDSPKDSGNEYFGFTQECREEIIWTRNQVTKQTDANPPASPVRARKRTNTFEPELAGSWDEFNSTQPTNERMPTIPLFEAFGEDSGTSGQPKQLSRLHHRQHALSEFVIKHKAPRVATKSKKESVLAELVTKKRPSSSSSRLTQARPPTPPKSRTRSTTLSSPRKHTTPKPNRRVNRKIAPSSLPFIDLDKDTSEMIESPGSDVFSKDAVELSAFETSMQDVMVWRRL